MALTSSNWFRTEVVRPLTTLLGRGRRSGTQVRSKQIRSGCHSYRLYVLKSYQPELPRTGDDQPGADFIIRICPISNMESIPDVILLQSLLKRLALGDFCIPTTSLYISFFPRLRFNFFFYFLLFFSWKTYEHVYVCGSVHMSPCLHVWRASFSD